MHALLWNSLELMLLYLKTLTMRKSPFADDFGPNQSLDNNVPLSFYKVNSLIKKRGKSRPIGDLCDFYPKIGSEGKTKVHKAHKGKHASPEHFEATSSDIKEEIKFCLLIQ